MHDRPVLTRRDDVNGENPYTACLEVESDNLAFQSSERSYSSIASAILVWTVVCILSAAPSFFFAFHNMAKKQALAMVLGVMVFIALYTLGDLVTRNTPARKNPRIRSILRATFIIRSLTVVIFPVAVFTDVMLGLLSVEIMTSITGPWNNNFHEGEMGFGVTLATTLLQGCLLSFLLVLMGMLITVVLFMIRSIASRIS